MSRKHCFSQGHKAVAKCQDDPTSFECQLLSFQGCPRPALLFHVSLGIPDCQPPLPRDSPRFLVNSPFSQSQHRNCHQSRTYTCFFRHSSESFSGNSNVTKDVPSSLFLKSCILWFFWNAFSRCIRSINLILSNYSFVPGYLWLVKL